MLGQNRDKVKPLTLYLWDSPMPTTLLSLETLDPPRKSFSQPNPQIRLLSAFSPSPGHKNSALVGQYLPGVNLWETETERSKSSNHIIRATSQTV